MKNTLTSNILLLIIMTLLSTHAPAQNVTSPYSILGIGDIDTKDYGRYFSSGSASLARRDPSSYNYSNPASLTSLPFKTMHFNIAMRGRNSTFISAGVDTASAISKDFAIKRVTMAFKVNEKTGIAFGLRPYSSVNYQYQDNSAILDGNTLYAKFIEGNGGVNQFYFSVGREMSKRLSVGVTGSWLFGSSQKTTQYSASSIDLDIIKQETNFHNGALLQGGIQYYSLPGKQWRHQLGLTGSLSTDLNSQITTEYIEAEVGIKENTETGNKFKMPLTVGFGYAATSADKLTISIEGNYYHWPYQKVNHTNSYTAPSFKLSGGLDYSFKGNSRNIAYEKSYVSCGINVENSYLRINSNRLWDYSFSAGGGFNPLKSLSIYTGIEFGIKGDEALGQIKEKYRQYIFGITVKDIWIGPKFRKYE